MRQNSTSFTSVLTMSLLSSSKLHWKTVINFFVACTWKVMAEELPPIKQTQEGKKEEKKIFNIAFGRNYLEYLSEASLSRFSKCSYLSNGGVLSSCCAEHNLNLRYIVSFNRIYSWLERIKRGSEFCTSKCLYFIGFGKAEVFDMTLKSFLGLWALLSGAIMIRQTSLRN